MTAEPARIAEAKARAEELLRDAAEGDWEAGCLEDWADDVLYLADQLAEECRVSDALRAELAAAREALRHIGPCVANLGLIVATFAPHGYDSSRPAAYDLAARLRTEIAAIKAALAAAPASPAEAHDLDVVSRPATPPTEGLQPRGENESTAPRTGRKGLTGHLHPAEAPQAEPASEPCCICSSAWEAGMRCPSCEAASTASAEGALAEPDTETPAKCPNPRCHEGWVGWGGNESGGAPPIPCRTDGCPHRADSSSGAT